MKDSTSFFRKLIRPTRILSRRSTTTPLRSAKIYEIGEGDVPEFEGLWEGIHGVLVEPDEKQILKGIKSTSVPAQITALLKALSVELERTTEGATGPYLEVFLNTEILSCMVTLSETDRPYGVRAEIMKFTTSFLHLLPHRFLLHSAIHQPISQLIRSSTRTTIRDLEAEGYLYGAAAASPSLRGGPNGSTEDLKGVGEGEGDEDEDDEEEKGRKLGLFLLVEVCQRIRLHPELLLVFLHDQTRSPIPPSSSTFTSTPSTPTIRMDFIFFSCLLRYINNEGRIGEAAREGMLLLFETVFKVPLPAHENVEGGRITEASGADEAEQREIFTLGEDKPTPAIERDDPVDDIMESDAAVDKARLALGIHAAEANLIEVLISGLGAVYSNLPTKIRLPAIRPGDIDYEGASPYDIDGGAGEDTIFDVDEGERNGSAGEELDYLPCMTDEHIQRQLDHLADLIDFIDYLIYICEDAPDTLGDGLRQVGKTLADLMRKTVALSLVEQVLGPFVDASSVYDGSSTAVACYIARLVRGAAMTEGSVMFIVLKKLLEEDVRLSEAERPGLGFLSVIITDADKNHIKQL